MTSRKANILKAIVLFFVLGAFGGIAGFALGGLIALGLFLISELPGPTFHKLWNDPQFRHLLSVAKDYANLLCYDYGYLPDTYDALLDLLVYMAKAQYGDMWSYKFPDLYWAYQEMLRRKNGSGSYSPPPPPPDVQRL